MANKSNWKGFEKLVAEALGGKRRLRTMEGDSLGYGNKATDIFFPKKQRQMFPILKRVAVECKKRRTLNVHQTFAEATVKYGEDGARFVVLASQVPRGRLGRTIKQFKVKTRKRYGIGSRLWKGRVKKLKRKRKKQGKEFTTKDLKRVQKSIDTRLKNVLREGIAKIKARQSVTALVTVDMRFFKQLWVSWLLESRRLNSE